MDVRNISQGGQANFDNVTTKVEKVTDEKARVIENGQNNATNNQNKSDTEKQLKEALDKLSKFIEDDNTKIEYQYHNKFNDLMIKIINKNTKEVILEVPPKKILDLIAKMMEMVGVLFDKKA